MPLAPLRVNLDVSTSRTKQVHVSIDDGVGILASVSSTALISRITSLQVHRVRHRAHGMLLALTYTRHYTHHIVTSYILLFCLVVFLLFDARKNTRVVSVY